MANTNQARMDALADAATLEAYAMGQRTVSGVWSLFFAAGAMALCSKPSAPLIAKVAASRAFDMVEGLR